MSVTTALDGACEIPLCLPAGYLFCVQHWLVWTLYTNSVVTHSSLEGAEPFHVSCLIESFRKLFPWSLSSSFAGEEGFGAYSSLPIRGLKLALRAEMLCWGLLVTRITERWPQPARQSQTQCLGGVFAFLTGSLVIQPVLPVWEPHFENQCPYRQSRQKPGSTISIILVLSPMVIGSCESYGRSENTLAQSILTAALSYKHAARTH